MKRSLLLILCILVLGSFVFAEGQGEGSGKTKKHAIMGSSSLGGSWYPTASRIAGVVMKYTDSVVTVQSSGGGTENIRLMKQGQYQMGMAESNIMVYGFQGIRDFDGDPYPELTFVTQLYPLIFQALVQKSTGWTTLADLKGKSFSPGSPGSGDVAAWEEVFDGAYGMGVDDMIWKPLSHNERSMAFKDRVLDCVGFETAVPAGAILEATAQNPGTILEIGGEARERLMKKYTWYDPWVIPAGTYNGQDKEVQTVIQGGGIIADASLNPDLIYDYVSAMYGPGLEAVQSVHSNAHYITLDTACDGRGPVPIHAGAEKFYKEKGVYK